MGAIHARLLFLKMDRIEELIGPRLFWSIYLSITFVTIEWNYRKL